mgnify:CR=1 FL=1
MATLIRIDRNGTKYYEGMVECPRCFGNGGYDNWMATGWTCWKCGGTGKVFSKWKEYTPEHEAKLRARRLAKIQKEQKELEAKAEAERFEREAKEEAERIAREAEEARIKAEKAKSQYVGKVGEKISTKATYIKTAWYDFMMGWMEQRMYIHTFKADGNTLVWKTSSNSLSSLEEGMEVEITGTIKEHSEYKDEKQTILNRCRIKKEEEQ